jgi:hypothetical protein
MYLNRAQCIESHVTFTNYVHHHLPIALNLPHFSASRQKSRLPHTFLPEPIQQSYHQSTLTTPAQYSSPGTITNPSKCRPAIPTHASKSIHPFLPSQHLTAPHILLRREGLLATTLILADLFRVNLLCEERMSSEASGALAERPEPGRCKSEQPDPET